MCFLLISPWTFAGLGKKNATDEYWILGAQFLQNYYSVYDFEAGKIGLVESKTSKIKPNPKSSAKAPTGPTATAQRKSKKVHHTKKSSKKSTNESEEEE